MDYKNRIAFLIIIAERKKKDELLPLLMQTGARIINTVYGKGSVRASTFMDILGFIPEENKIIITCLIPKEKSDSLLETLNEEYSFNKSNTGIAFTIPVEGLSF